MEVSAHGGHDDASGGDALGDFVLTEDAGFDGGDGRIVDVLVHLAAVAPRAVVETHLQLAAVQAVRRRRPADGVRGVGRDDPARQSRIDHRLHEIFRFHCSFHILNSN